MAEQDNVDTAVLRVMEKVGFVAKTGQMSERAGGYNYASEADLIRALRPAMIEEGLVITPKEVEVVSNEEYQSSSRAVMHRTMVRVSYVLHHTASNTSRVLQMLGEGTDSGDKAVYKALTGALKYVLRTTFVIETGDDPDATSSEQQHKAAPQQSQQSSQKKESKPTSAPPQAQVGFDPEQMNKAIAYTVPPGLPQAGSTLGKLVSDPSMGPIMIGFLACKSPDGTGKMYEPGTEDEKRLSAAAAYVYEHNPTFQATLKKYQESVK